MNQLTYKKRCNVIYLISALILILLSVCLLIKPCLKAVFPLKYEDLIKKYSSMYDLDEFLVMALISAESKFDENAVSRKGAKGLMQLKDETKKWCIEKFEIDENQEKNALNINIGCAYLNYLLQKYENCTPTALAAYNAGEGNVSKWLLEQGTDGVELISIPYGETRDYVKKINKRTKIYQFLYS